MIEEEFVEQLQFLIEYAENDRWDSASVKSDFLCHVASMQKQIEADRKGTIIVEKFLSDSIKYALNDANARIAELEAQVNAVPVEALIALHDYSDTCTQAQIDAVSAWIDTVTA